MTRIRRRQARSRRGDSLTPWQHWSVQSGQKSGSAFASERDWEDAYHAIRDSLLDSCDDLTTGFQGFWANEPDIPEPLRRNRTRWDGLLCEDPERRAEIEVEYRTHIEARRVWLREHGWAEYTS